MSTAAVLQQPPLHPINDTPDAQREHALARQVNAAVLRSPRIDISTIGEQISIRVGQRTKKGEPLPLVTTWYVAKSSLKKVGLQGILGAILGTGAGFAAAGITSAINPKAGAKAMKYGVAAAGVAGFAIGAVEGARSVKRQVALRRRVEEMTTVDTKVIREMCQGFFDVYFNAADGEDGAPIFCPISQDIMSIPVYVRCYKKVKHTFDLASISQWLGSHDTCPKCRRRINPRHLRLNTESLNRIYTVIQEALAMLSRVCQVDLFDDDYIARVLETGQDADGKPIRPAFDRETMQRIRAGQLTAFEGCILARYLRTPLKEYNRVMEETWSQLQTGLENDRREGRLTPAGYQAEAAKLSAWYEAVTVTL